MKTIKTVLVAIMVCAAAALISMVGMFPAAVYRDNPVNRQAQTETQLPEILPAIAVDFTAIDKIFQ